MDIEKTGAREDAIPTNPLTQLYRTIAETFKTSVERKDSSEISHLTKLTKTISGKINGKAFFDLLKELKTPFAEIILDGLANNVGEFPSPKTEEEIFQLILLALHHFKERRFENVTKILHSLLFEKPQELCQRTYLESLSNYLLYKYLNAVEFSGKFNDQKQSLYITLKGMQAIKSEALFSTVYIFILRNLFLNTNSSV